MLRRQPRWQSIFLSPAVSVIVATVGAIMLIVAGSDWLITLPLSVAISATMVAEIKSQGMFRGSNFPFAAFFMLLQGAIVPSVDGALIAALGVGALVAAFHSFMRADHTRLLFTLCLAGGSLALWNRAFALLTVVMVVSFIAVRGLSMRGVTASLLGFVTPAILLGAAGVVNVNEVIAEYNGRWLQFPAPLVPEIVLAALVMLSSLIMFLPSYGYPAKQRACNMAVLLFSAGAIVISAVDYMNAEVFCPLLGVCFAYQAAHMAASRGGWISALINCAIIVSLTFMSR